MTRTAPNRGDAPPAAIADPLRRVRATLDARKTAGLYRTLSPRASGDAVLDLSGNDYLGLARDPRVVTAAAAAALEWGAGATGSRLVSGSTELHAELEYQLAAFTGAPAALVFSSGFLANLGVLTALGGPEVTVVSDAGNHASLIDGCRLSGSPIRVVPHRDPVALRETLAQVRTPHALVVTDAVFSVDGDLADLRAVYDLAHAHGALLIVDEAHALGVVGADGSGGVVAAGLADRRDIVRTLTLSKSLGSQGGAVVAAPEVIALLVNTARAFIFDTALAPSCAGAALAALQILEREPYRAAAARAAARSLAGVVADLGLPARVPDAAVVPAVLGDPQRAVAAAAHCARRGVRVGCFRPPSVPHGGSCLRLSARADLTDADIARVADVLTEAVRAVGGATCDTRDAP